jgi:hypothetical protein
MQSFLTIFFIILLISLFLTGLLLLLHRLFGTPETCRDHFHPSIFEFFTTLYAIFLGFALFTLWSAYLNAERNVSKEAAILLSAYRGSLDLPDSQDFRQALRDYVKLVIEDEWDRMQVGTMSPGANQNFDRVWGQLQLLRPKPGGNSDMYLHVTALLEEASSQRLARRNFLAGNLSPPIWVIIIFGFTTILFGIYFLHEQPNVVRLIFNFMLLFLLLSCIYVIYDIDTPFSGLVTVKPDVFKFVQTKIQALP